MGQIKNIKLPIVTDIKFSKPLLAMSTDAEPEVAKKSIYVGNLGSNVTNDDLTQLFGLGATPFLQKTCCVDVACDDKTGKSKNFAIVTVPEHVHSELIKLNGIEFYGRQIVIEEAKTKPSDTDKDKENKDKRKGGSGGGGGGRGYNNNYNNRGGRGNYRGGRGGRGRAWGGRPISKFNLPTLEPDQVFHL